MNDMVESTWLVTGASSGLGLAIARHALEHGHRVVLAARTAAPMHALADAYADTAEVVVLDVTDAAQRAAAIDRTHERFGSLDILVNNAGIDYLGAIEEQEEEDYRQTFEVNFFGAVALLRLALPGMRARGRGVIANMSSMDGMASLAANGYYSSSKFALEGLTEALWQEIAPLGLVATLIEPGSFRTGIEARTRFSGATIDAYEATSGAFRVAMENSDDAMFPGDPVSAAAVIFDVLTSQAIPQRLILGGDAHRRVAAKLTKLCEEHQAGRELAYSTDFAR
jgi:NAD(P)-dependent dehydrogenase (short-subunit alcohol dehydrogenase family)